MIDNSETESEAAPIAAPVRLVGVHRGYQIVEHPAAPGVVRAGGNKTKCIVVDPASGKPLWRACQTVRQAKQMINFELAQKGSPE